MPSANAGVIASIETLARAMQANLTFARFIARSEVKPNESSLRVTNSTSLNHFLIPRPEYAHAVAVPSRWVWLMRLLERKKLIVSIGYSAAPEEFGIRTELRQALSALIGNLQAK